VSAGASFLSLEFLLCSLAPCRLCREFLWDLHGSRAVNQGCEPPRPPHPCACCPLPSQVKRMVRALVVREQLLPRPGPAAGQRVGTMGTAKVWDLRSRAPCRPFPTSPRCASCTVLHCTGRYGTVLYCTVQYCPELCCTVCTVLYRTVLYCTVGYSSHDWCLQGQASQREFPC